MTNKESAVKGIMEAIEHKKELKRKAIADCKAMKVDATYRNMKRRRFKWWLLLRVKTTVLESI